MVDKFNLISESIFKALHKMTQDADDIGKLLKAYFEAGVTPEFAEDPREAKAIKGWLGLFCLFLGGLSLHLNHLIGSRMRISYRSFGTLPIGILFSNLDSGQLMTCPRTLSGQIWHMSIFGDSRAV